MATACVEEDLAVQAARILLTLKNRRLLRWPEWVEKEPAMVLLEVGLSPEWRPKRERSGKRRPGKGDYRPVLKKLGLATSAGSSGVGARALAMLEGEAQGGGTAAGLSDV
jgi:hypothetical protein